MTVFVAGLMVGRTPEYLRKKITAREIKLVSLYILTMPVLVLGAARPGDGAAGPEGRRSSTPAHTGCPRSCTRSCRRTNNNGSAFAGLNANTSFYNTALGVVMLARPVRADHPGARPWPGRWPASSPCPRPPGTLPTHRPLFVGMLVGVAIIVAGLTFFPVLALGPMAEGL